MGGLTLSNYLINTFCEIRALAVCTSNPEPCTLVPNTTPLNPHPQKQVIEEKHEAVEHTWRFSGGFTSGGFSGFRVWGLFFRA